MNAEIPGNTKLVNNQLINAYNQPIGFPMNGGTLALLSDIKQFDNDNDNNVNILQQEINYLATRLQATLQYFQNKMNTVNLSFSDIIEKVDAAVVSSSRKQCFKICFYRNVAQTCSNTNN